MYSMIKRFLDIVLSVIALILLSPIMIVVSILIKLESKGPIHFKQRRIGIDASEFIIYKYRSMRIDTPDVATDKLGDPSIYITKIGRILRKTSLDELPQLFNILKGDMSIVGPRPALYNQYELTEKRNNYNINSIRPGLTGYAQIKGRDLISEDEKVMYDKYYYENRNLRFDIKIVFLTIKDVVASEGVSGV